jgi:phosphate starvation-inducible PhoH-like protein
MHGVAIQSIEHIGEKEVQCILVDNPEHLYITDQYIVTHNTLEEKMGVWLAETIGILKMTLGPEAYEIALKHGDIEIVPFEVIRGRSLNNSFILLTEAQNTTIKEIKAFVTRTGENSKVVIDGDINQSDIGPNNGLIWAINMIKKYDSLSDLTGITEFNSDDIVRSGLCGAWVRAIEHTATES